MKIIVKAESKQLAAVWLAGFTAVVVTETLVNQRLTEKERHRFLKGCVWPW